MKYIFYYGLINTFIASLLYKCSNKPMIGKQWFKKTKRICKYICKNGVGKVLVNAGGLNKTAKSDLRKGELS